MRTVWLGLLGMCVFVGCGGRPLPPGRDMSAGGGGGKDMAVAEDLAVPGDLGPVDMAIPNDALKPVLYSQFAVDYAKAVCLHLAQCGQVGTDAASQTACLEQEAQPFGIDWDTEVMRGHVVINELQCLDAIMNSRCDQSDQGYIADQCIRFLFEPRQQAGQACVDTRECVNGYCLLPTSAGGGYQPPGCPGTCQPFKTTTCDTLDSCDRYVAFCTNGMCAPRPMQGQSCTFSCAAGLYCPSWGTKTCQMPMMQMAAGGACDPNQSQATNVPACGPTLYCKYNSSTPTAATCAPKIPKGMPCDPSLYNSLTDNACQDGYHCDTTATPTPVCAPYGTSGAKCASNTDCQVGFYCDGTKHCAAKIADGQPCDPSVPASCLAFDGFINSCVAADSDAGSFTTCQRTENVGASCDPTFSTNLCYPSGGSEVRNACVATKNGGGVCAPSCM